MGLGAIGELQMRSRGPNGRSHTNFMSLYHPPKGTLGLAALDDDTVDIDPNLSKSIKI